VLEGDIRDGEFLVRACRGVSVVFHMASLIDVTGALDYRELYTVNVKGLSPSMLSLGLTVVTDKCDFQRSQNDSNGSFA